MEKLSNEEIILRDIKKIEEIDPRLAKAIIGLIKEKNELLDFARIDHLTGIYNRRILDSVRRYSVVVMCDIDNFKNINDTYGHDKGDEILKQVAKTLSKNIRFDDVVCRYGGDEFLIIFTGCDEKVVVNRIIEIKKELLRVIPDLKISLSSGISSYKAGSTLKDTITEADIALYKSKEKGKNLITIYDEKEMKLSKR